MRFVSTFWFGAVVLAAGSLSASARAAGCPPGDWFCDPPEDAGPKAPAAQTAPDVPPPPPPPEEQLPPGEGRSRRPPPPGAPPPPPGPPLVFSDPYWEPPPPPRRRWYPWRPEWGFGVHGFGAIFGSSGASHNAGMGGPGLTLRFRPARAFALDASGEFAFGTDYNGFDRNEQTLLLNAVGFLNPRDRAQFYLFGGFGLGTARVRTKQYGGELHPTYVTRHYDYLGINGGVGLELRVLRALALNVDLVGFVRDRVDDNSGGAEYVDVGRGRQTDTSAGALVRGGIMFYW